ncbi:MAG: hypothetical protein EOP84_18990 [Verrucomicrobiaceae bacterium]|nr:MAG: hypothetical protein EOP84_18990 [Verrucomicrobiaceae bacterium]
MKTALKVSALTLALLLALGLWLAYTTGAFLRATDVHVADPDGAVREARRLIKSFRASAPAEQLSQFLSPEHLPQSLCVPRLRYAYVFRDHINLVLSRNSDWSAGVRIWSTDAATLHADQPTSYRDIYFFQYNNDLPRSPQNLP